MFHLWQHRLKMRYLIRHKFTNVPVLLLKFYKGIIFHHWLHVITMTQRQHEHMTLSHQFYHYMCKYRYITQWKSYVKLLQLQRITAKHQYKLGIHYWRIWRSELALIRQTLRMQRIATQHYDRHVRTQTLQNWKDHSSLQIYSKQMHTYSIQYYLRTSLLKVLYRWYDLVSSRHDNASFNSIARIHYKKKLKLRTFQQLYDQFLWHRSRVQFKRTALKFRLNRLVRQW